MIWIADDFFGAGGADWLPPGAPPPGARARPAAAAVDRDGGALLAAGGAHRHHALPWRLPRGRRRRRRWPPPPGGPYIEPPAWRRRGPARRRIHAPIGCAYTICPRGPIICPCAHRGGGGAAAAAGTADGRRAVGRSEGRRRTYCGGTCPGSVHKHHIRVAGAHPAPHHLLLVLRMHAALLHPRARERPQRRAGSASAQILGASAERVRGRRLGGQRIAGGARLVPMPPGRWPCGGGGWLPLGGCWRGGLAAAAARRRLAAGSAARRCRGRRVVRCSALEVVV